MGIIAGICSKNPDSSLSTKLSRMLACQKHRDESKPVRTEEAYGALGNANKHDRVFCDAKKEISKYAYPDLSILLDGIVLDVPKHIDFFNNIGEPITDPSCSGVVASAYRKWGADFMEHLEGEFSCAVWDRKKKQIILARDPNGHKPLHYYHDNNTFIFSSEIKGILAAGVHREIDWVSLSDFISLNNIPYPSTIFKNIYQVSPGEILVWDSNNGLRGKRYWTPQIAVDDTIQFDDAVDLLSETLQKAVRKRSITQDTYCFLSGGIDSSAIVSFSSQIPGKKVHAISVGFDDDFKNELEDAEIMAKHAGAELHPIIVKPDSFFDMMETMVYHHDSPFTDTSAYPTYYAAKHARKYTDVILTGDGPDQSLAGSSHYVFALQNNIFQKRHELFKNINNVVAKCAGRFARSPVPAFLSKIERKCYRNSLSPVQAAYDLRSYFPDIVKKFVFSSDLWKIHLDNIPYRHPDAWFKEAGGVDDINKYLYADMKFYVPDDLMVKVDRMSMAHGLETLSPFQDKSFLRLVNKLPGSFKIKQLNDGTISTKHILKKVCEKRFPPEILHKKKQGFAIPLEKWLRIDNGNMIRQILLDGHAFNKEFVKEGAMEKIVETFIHGKGDYFFPSASGIVGLLTLEILMKR